MIKLKPYCEISEVIREQAPMLASLQQKANLLAKIKDVLFNELPKELTGQLRIKNVHQGIIELSITSPVIATRIRHQAPSLLKKINEAFPEPRFYQLQCQVNPSIMQEEKTVELPKQKAIPLSDHTKEKLAALSSNISHPALAEALKKLSTSTPAPRTDFTV